MSPVCMVTAALMSTCTISTGGLIAVIGKKIRAKNGEKESPAQIKGEQACQ